MVQRYGQTLCLAALLFGAGAWPAVATAQGSWDACQMLQKADVEGAFAPRKFDNGTLAKDVVKRTAKMAESSTCTYVSTGAKPQDVFTVLLIARRAPTDALSVTPEMARKAAVQINAKAILVDLPELGPGAHWADMGSKMFPTVELNAFRGQRVFLTFSGGGMPVGQQAIVAGLTKIAKATLPRVP
jgi:hypothetical protein